jgi:hypothetical protein
MNDARRDGAAIMEDHIGHLMTLVLEKPSRGRTGDGDGCEGDSDEGERAGRQVTHCKLLSPKRLLPIRHSTYAKQQVNTMNCKGRHS